MKVYVVGCGMGNPDTLTVEAARAIEAADVLIGAERLVAPYRGGTREVLALTRAADIERTLRERAGAGNAGSGAGVAGAAGAGASRPTQTAAVLLSGDVGFYSGAAALSERLEGFDVEVIAGISSVAYFCAKLRVSWQDARLVSAHGRAHNAVGEIQCHAKTFLLTGGATKAHDICRDLVRRGFGDVRVAVGERLSYEDERIVRGSASELAGDQFTDLAVMLVENDRPVRQAAAPALADGDFERTDVPMTKEEVRALALSKLRLEAHHVVWDVGAGTGSVSVECALSCPAGRVYAVEKKEEALALLAENRARFHAANLEVVAGTAPEALEALSAPDRDFLGGTSGSLEDILNVIFRKNPAARVVCTAVTLETVGEAARCFAGLEGADMVQVAVTRTRPAGRYHLMDAQNPVWIFSGEGRA